MSYAKSRKRFHHFNNGLIVVAKSYSIREEKSKKQGGEPRKFVRLVEPQIVNGLQTVKSIYNAVASGDVSVEDLRSECLVQMKVIQTGEADFVARVVQSTNNQNPMSARNLKGNTQEQRLLRAGLASLSPGWFLQVKEGEWESITDEVGRFFESIVGQSMAAFRPNPRVKRGRVIDNQEAAKAWLAFIGFADKAGERVAHFSPIRTRTTYRSAGDPQSNTGTSLVKGRGRNEDNLWAPLIGKANYFPINTHACPWF